MLELGFRTIALACVLLGGPFVRAGGHIVGNGGDGVVCKDAAGNITSVELLDFYEARVFRGIPFDLGGANVPVLEKLELAIARLDSLSPLRAQMYRADVEEFFNRQARFLKGIRLVDIPDSGHLAFPENCEVRQVAIQAEPMFPEDLIYTIDQDLWDLMDNDNKAGLVLHEIIFREAIAAGAVDSRNVRYFNSYLTGNKLGGFRQSNFLAFMKKLGFDLGEFNGVCIYLNGRPNSVWPGIVFFEHGEVDNAPTCNINEIGPHIITSETEEQKSTRVYFETNGDLKEFTRAGFFQLKVPAGSIEGRNYLSFYPDRTVKKAEDVRNLDFETPFLRFQIGKAFSFEFIEFFQSGVMKTLGNLEGRSDDWKLWDRYKPDMRVKTEIGELELRWGSFPIHFWENGKVREISTVRIPESFTGCSGCLGAKVGFHENGKWSLLKFSSGIKGEVFHVSVQGRQIGFQVLPGFAFETFPNGVLKAGTLATKQKLKTTKGKERAFSAGTQVRFGEDGLVIEGER